MNGITKLSASSPFVVAAISWSPINESSSSDESESETESNDQVGGVEIINGADDDN